MARKRSKSKSKATASVEKRGRRGKEGTDSDSIARERKVQYACGVGIIKILAIAAALYVASSSKERRRHPSSESEIRNSNKIAEKEAFLKWFVDGGGTFHPIDLWGDEGKKSANATIEEFPSYGGWGLALPIPPGSYNRASKDNHDGDDGCRSEIAEGRCEAEDGKLPPVIRHLDPLFTVPPSMIVSVESVIDDYASASGRPLYLLNKILTRTFPNSPGLARRGMGLVQQDVVIAMHLAVEDCRHRHARLFARGETETGSRWGAYLDVLPQYAIPRLDTFGDEEYAALMDENLERTGRNSRRLLERMYSNDGKGVSGPSLKTVLQAMIRSKNGPTPSPLIVPESCMSFETFHRFVGIVSSRAMVLKGVKHLTPLAEMINYSPKTATRQIEESKDRIRAPFDIYHTFSDDGSITVRSDRDVFLDAETPPGGVSIQLFEDYGPVDSSLFLEAHGFVPLENPNDCAAIPGSSFVRRGAAAGRHDERADSALRALKALRLIHPETKEFEALEEVCVRGDLGIVDDGDAVGRKPASDSIAIVSLLLGDSDVVGNDVGEDFVSTREKCMGAIRSGDAERTEIRCARYPGSVRVVKRALRRAAGRFNERLDDDGDTEEKLQLELQRAESQSRKRLVVALRFRIEERKILKQIAESAEEDRNENEDTITHQKESSENLENLEAKLIAFNFFIESLELPLNEIEPKLVGNGMRIGTYAKKDLDIGDAYISLPADSVIDVSTVLSGEDSGLAKLLRKYSELDPQQNDGFDTMLLYLLHERFLLKEQSHWWPYLNLLPSIEELRAFHPLFFEEEEINRHLAGSDVRRFILRYQQRAAERLTALCSDPDAVLELGSDVLLDKGKIYWATAILDSRSIWWGGKRHLSPLLDLVNSDNEGRAHETRLEDSDDMKQKNAVTLASRRVRKGEQLFENYGQPNYLLFTYHGFLLEENANDCALLDGLFIHHNDPGAKSAHTLQSRTPTFCIRDLASVESLAEFLRIKHGLATGNTSMSAIDHDVRPHLIAVLEERTNRLAEAVGVVIDAKRFAFHQLIVKNDLMHFQHALNTHVLAHN